MPKSRQEINESSRERLGKISLTMTILKKDYENKIKYNFTHADIYHAGTKFLLSQMGINDECNLQQTAT